PGIWLDGAPLVRGQFHIHLDSGGGLPKLVIHLQAGAVTRIPAVDAKAHGRPGPADRGPAVGRHLHPAGHSASAGAAKPSLATVEVRASLDTVNRTGTRSARAATCVITPTIRWPWARVSNVLATT